MNLVESVAEAIGNSEARRKWTAKVLAIRAINAIAVELEASKTEILIPAGLHACYQNSARWLRAQAKEEK